MMRLFIAMTVPIWFYATGSAGAQETDTGQAESVIDGSLAGYQAYGRTHNPTIEAAEAEAEVETRRVAAARRLPDPTVSYAYYVRSVETRVGPQRHRLSVRQSFPWPTQLTAGADRAEAKSRAASDETAVSEVDLSAAIARRYWTIWSLRESRKIHETHLEVLRGLSESAGGLLATGRITLSDKQQIDLAAAQVEDLIASLDAARIQSEAALKGLIGAPQSMAISITDRPPGPAVERDEAALKDAAHTHPAIRRYDALVSASEAGAEQEGARRLPRFSLHADWIETGPAAMPDTPDSGKDAVLIGFSLDLPLWQRNYKESVGAYRAESKIYRARRQAALDRADADLSQNLTALRDAARRLDLYENTLLPQAEGILDSVLGAYMSGQSGIATVLRAQETLLELRVSLVQVKTEAATLRAEQDRIVGRGPEPHTAKNKNGGPR